MIAVSVMISASPLNRLELEGHDFVTLIVLVKRMDNCIELHADRDFVEAAVQGRQDADTFWKLNQAESEGLEFTRHLVARGRRMPYDRKTP